LQRFCHLQQQFDAGKSVTNLGRVMKESSMKNLRDTSIEISRDTFALVLQDSKVQKLMDDLDIAADRANLFDVLDADGSGSIDIKEFIEGLLKVRGEPQRSDVLAGVLGIRATLSALEGIQHKMEELGDKLEVHTADVLRGIQAEKRIEQTDGNDQSEKLPSKLVSTL